MPAAIKSAETAMRIGDPNSAHLHGERLAEVPVDAVPISLAVTSCAEADAAIAMAMLADAAPMIVRIVMALRPIEDSCT